MAEEVALAQAELGLLASSPGSKRKRNPESSSPDSRRSKRSVPGNLSVSDADTDAFLENTVSIAQAAQAQTAQAHAQAAQDHADVVDFSALAQATADHNDVADSAAAASSTAAAALNLSFPTLHVPAPTEETYAAQAVEQQQQHQAHSQQHQPHPQQHHHQPQPQPHPGQHHPQVHDNSTFPDTNQGLPPPGPANSMPQINGIVQDTPRYGAPPKPAVGSEEWHKMRKDNHKEGKATSHIRPQLFPPLAGIHHLASHVHTLRPSAVERRRRETINEGINELAKIVPNCEKNKGSILQKAVAFIQQLKENESQNIEKWTLEKLLTEQAIAELSQSNDKLKQECERLYRELETWKKVAQNAGLQPQKEENAADS